MRYLAALSVLLTSVCWAQFTVDQKDMLQITGVGTIEVYPEQVLVERKDTPVATTPVAVFHVTAPENASISMDAIDSNFDSPEIVDLKPRSYMITEPGKYRVSFFMFDTGKFEIKRFTVTVPESEPKPNPPDPPVGSTVEEQVRELTKGLSKNGELAKVFEKHSSIFESTDGNTSQLFEDWKVDMRGVLGETDTEYRALSSYMSTHINTNWPMSNSQTAIFFLQISKGLK